MTKLVIVTKNENGLIEITEESFKKALDDAQKEAYEEGLQIGYLKGQASVFAQPSPTHKCKCHEEEIPQGECCNSRD